MTLRKRILLILGLVLLAWILLVYAASSAVLLGRIDALEKAKTRQAIERCAAEISGEQRALEASASDWGAWDSAYAWLSGETNGFPEQNLDGDALGRLGVNFVAFIRTSGEVAAARVFDLQRHEPLPLPKDLAIQAPLFLSLGGGRGGSGMAILGGVPMLLAMRPVLKGDETGPAAGCVVIGRYIDASMEEQISRSTGSRTTISTREKSDLASLIQGSSEGPAASGEPIVRVLGSDSIAGYVCMKDVTGTSVLVLKVQLPRDLHRQGLISLLILVVAELATGGILILIIYRFLERAVLWRVERLANEVRLWTLSSSAAGAPSHDVGDELTNLKHSLHRAFSELEDYRTSLETARDDLEEMVEARTSALARTNEELMRQISERKKIEEVRTATYQISEAANSSRSLGELFPALQVIISSLMPAKNFYVALYDPREDLFTFPYYVDEFDAPPGPQRAQRGLTEYIFRTGAPLLVTPEVFEDLMARNEVEEKGAPCIDWLGVPLKIQERTLGVLVVQSYTEGIRYTEEDKNILQFVSVQVAMAIQRKRDEEAVRRSEERYRTLVENLGEGLSIVDAEENFTFTNSAAERIFGVPPGTLSGRNLREFVGEETFRRIAEQTALRRKGEISVYEIEILRPDGERRILRVTAVPQFGEEEQFVSALALFFDITQELAWQEELQRARRLEAVGLVAGGVAHEVRNPLFALRTVATALEKKLGGAEQYKPFTDHINGQVKKLSDLMNDLLTLGRPLDATVCQPYDLKDVVKEALGALEQSFPEATSRFALDMPAQPLRSHGAPDRLSRALMNLFQNAHQLTPLSETIRVKVVGDGQSLAVEVSDPGPGIPQELLPRIFEPFQSRRKGGTGLGLAIVRKIVEDHAGTVTAENNGDAPGACFRITLPVLGKEDLEKRLTAKVPELGKPPLEEREERRKIQERLVDSERRFRTLFEGAGDAIFIMSGDTFVDCNQRTCEVFACSKEDILSRRPYDFSPPLQPDGRESKEKALEKIGAALGGEHQFFEWMHKKLDGTPFQAEVSLTRVAIAGMPMVQAIVRDISHKKRAEAAFRASEERYLNLIDTMNEGLMVVDNDDSILFVNSQACAMFGYTEPELIGRKGHDFLAAPEYGPLILEKNRLRTLGIADRYEAEMIKKGGERIWVMVSGSPLKNAEGVVEGSIGVLTDITERKRADLEMARIEHEHRKARSLESLGLLTQGLAHEVRNPIFAINLNLTALERQVEAKSDISVYVGHVRDQVQRLDALMRDVIEMGRPLKQADFSDCSAQEILKSAFAIVRENYPLSWEHVLVDEPAEPLIVRAVPAKLSLAVAHLVRNALECSESRGRVRVKALAEDGQVVIRVSDDGPGLPPKLKAILFEPFVTSRTGHTGLGLALARHYVEGHGGTLRGEDNQPPPGATFTVRVPAPPGGPCDGEEGPRQPGVREGTAP